MKVPFTFLLLFPACFLLTQLPAYGASKWLYGKSQHFEFLSNTTRSATERNIDELENFHRAFQHLFPHLSPPENRPVLVYIFKNEKSFKEFAPLHNGKPKPIAGFFSEDPKQSILAFRLGGDSSATRHVINHEYIHYLLSYNPEPRAIWYEEGLAELCSTLQITNKKIIWGTPIAHHILLLQKEGLIPLERFLAITKGSPEYNEEERIGQFYAQSWVFLHYCHFGNNRTYAESPSKYSAIYRSGGDARKVFIEAFGTDYDSFEKELEEYISAGKFLTWDPNYENKTSGFISEMDIAPEARVQYSLGKLLTHTQRGEEALQYLEGALELQPDWPKPYEVLGKLAIQQKSFDLAEEYFNRAADLKSDNPEVYYFLASLTMGMGNGRIFSTESKDETLPKVYRFLVYAINLNPYYLPPYHDLAKALEFSGKKASESSLNFLKQGLLVNPNNSFLAFKIAKLEIRSGFPENARKTLNPFITSANYDFVRKQAEKLWLETGAELP